MNFDLYKEWDTAYQKAADVMEAVKQGNEFWMNHYFYAVKEFFNTSKTK